jgi:hypothetical protein
MLKMMTNANNGNVNESLLGNLDAGLAVLPPSMHGAHARAADWLRASASASTNASASAMAVAADSAYPSWKDQCVTTAV